MSTSLDEYPGVTIDVSHENPDRPRVMATFMIARYVDAEDATTRSLGQAAVMAASAVYRAAGATVLPVVKLDWSRLFGVGFSVVDQYGNGYECVKRKLAGGDDLLTFRAPDGMETEVDTREALELLETRAWRLP